MHSNLAYKELVSFFGNQHNTAEALGCTQPAVWKWVQGKCYMSAPLAIKAEKLTNGAVRAIDLCPALESIPNTTTA